MLPHLPGVPHLHVNGPLLPPSSLCLGATNHQSVVSRENRCSNNILDWLRFLISVGRREKMIFPLNFSMVKRMLVCWLLMSFKKGIASRTKWFKKEGVVYITKNRISGLQGSHIVLTLGHFMVSHSFSSGDPMKRFGQNDMKVLRFYDVIFMYMTPSVYFAQIRTFSLFS